MAHEPARLHYQHIALLSAAALYLSFYNSLFKTNAACLPSSALYNYKSANGALFAAWRIVAQF
jgi:hypothetical protein